MILLPLFAALSSVLTEALSNAGWYRPIQKYVVPWEARLVAATIAPLGIEARVTSNPKAAFYMVKQGMAMPVDLSWNCLGWQSALLLVISLVAGLRGNYSYFSRIQCVLFGFLGTLFVNVLRMALVAGGIYYVNSLFGMVVHDYFAAFVTILWLLGFWWFSYSYILQHRSAKGGQLN